MSLEEQEEPTQIYINTHDEGRRGQEPKRCDNKKDENKSPNINSVNCHKCSCQKFKQEEDTAFDIFVFVNNSRMKCSGKHTRECLLHKLPVLGKTMSE